MKICEIKTHRLSGGTVDGGWPAGHEPEDDLHTLVEIVSDEGLTGIGSVFTCAALVEAGVETLRPLWQNESAIEPERVSEKLRQSSFWQGRGGTLEHVISGIDIALWDLLGKACGQPVARLLGGYYRRKIKPYGSLLFDEPEPLAEQLRATVERGFRAIKLGWRPFGRRDSKFDETLVRIARETVGPDVELMVDAGGSEQFWPHGYKWALRTSQMLADYDIVWFEEPLSPDDLEGFVRLRNASPVPIAGGEVLTRRQSFLPWIERGAFDIVQPDVTKCGGLSEARRIAWMAYDHQHAHGQSRLEHSRGCRRRSAPGGGYAIGKLRRVSDSGSLHRRNHRRTVSTGRPGLSDHLRATWPGNRTQSGRAATFCQITSESPADQRTF